MPRDPTALTAAERRVLLFALEREIHRLRDLHAVRVDLAEHELGIGRDDDAEIWRWTAEDSGREIALLESAAAKLGATPAPGHEGER